MVCSFINRAVSRFVPISEFRISFWFMPPVPFAQPQVETGTLPQRRQSKHGIHPGRQGSSCWSGSKQQPWRAKGWAERSLQLCLSLAHHQHCFGSSESRVLTQLWDNTFPRSICENRSLCRPSLKAVELTCWWKQQPFGGAQGKRDLWTERCHQQKSNVGPQSLVDITPYLGVDLGQAPWGVQHRCQGEEPPLPDT